VGIVEPRLLFRSISRNLCVFWVESNYVRECIAGVDLPKMCPNFESQFV
jgi:hypothetical protein